MDDDGTAPGGGESDDLATTTERRGESVGEHPRARWFLLLSVAVGVVALDQLSKWWAVNELSTRHIDLVWTLRFALTFNSGASFSMGGDKGRYIGLLVVVVAGVVLWSGRHATTRLAAISRGMIVGGAIGNLLDRVFRADNGFLSGKVVDFIDPQRFPVFNVADSAVVIGCGLLVLSTLLDDRHRSE